MALRFRELPWYFQTLIFVAVALVVGFVGETIDLPPALPLVQAKTQQATLEAQLSQLRQEVAGLQAAKQRRQKLRTDLAATREQLARVQQLVPQEKQTDDFMRTLQGSATNSLVKLRRLTARSVVFKEFYAEMPFEVELDGGYYNMQDFFDRLGNTTRIISAGGLKLEGIQAGQGGKWDYAPGTTVAGTVVVTTYYIPPQAELEAAAPAGGARGRRPPGQ